MKSKPNSFWSGLGWTSFIVFAVLIIAGTVEQYWYVQDSQKQLSSLFASLEETEKTIESYEALQSEFKTLRSRNSFLVEKISKLNAVSETIDQFVIADQDQIITHSISELNTDLEWGYRGYVPAGTHVFDLAFFESDSTIETETGRAKYSAKFELNGPTKFEIICTGKETPYKSLEAVLHLPGKPNAKQATIQFQRPFSVRGRGRYHNWRDGLPVYPNEYDLQADYLISEFKQGVTACDNRLGFQTLFVDQSTGRLAIVATIHSDCQYCLKAGDALSNRYSVGRPFGYQPAAEHLLNLLTPDPNLSSRMLLDKRLNEWLHQKPMRGTVLDQ